MKNALYLLILPLLFSEVSVSAAQERPAGIKKLEGIVIPSPATGAKSTETDPEKKAGTEPPKQTVFNVKSLDGDVRTFDTAFTKEAFDNYQKRQQPQQQAPQAVQPQQAQQPQQQPQEPQQSAIPAPPEAPGVGEMVEVSYVLAGANNQPALTEPVKIIGRTIKGTINEIAMDKSFIVVRTKNDKYPESEINIPLQSNIKFQALLASMRAGDGINGAYFREGGFNVIRSLEWQSKSVDRLARWVALISGIVFLYLLAYIFSKRKPSGLILGDDNRYSTSKFQTVIWFWLVISAYIAIVAHRFLASDWDYIGGVDIPINLLALSGLSVFTFTAAKFITLGKIDQANEKGQEAKTRAERPRIADLVHNDDGKVDLGDYQMLVITILAVVVYAVGVVEFMETIEFRRVVTMPDVDATLLAIFGLGQLAYLGKKAAGESVAATASEHISKTIASVATNAKADAGKTEKAVQEAEAKVTEAKTAGEAAAKAANKAAADLEAKKAATAARSARETAEQANIAGNSAEANAEEAKKISDG